ncbi:phage tail protein [Sphingobium lignivorans]|uniref:Tip attachment protein J domain-containing protein n=1 Tax=Sphingobium lignivorans TaxID=2735886 RepID=A0ABR6NJI9_9SPHN|nr:phage tail protein [Sphingobium lignivorans]MBB5987440.1 hypothetical protein [Sphingobium lignivorans]
MSRVVDFVVGAATVVAGVLLAPVSPLIGSQLIIAGAAMFASSALNALLAPSRGNAERQAAETALNIGEEPRRAIFGRGATGGSLVDAFNYGGEHGTDWEVLVIALADHRCDAIEGFWVNDQYVTYTGDGFVPGFNNQLQIYTRLGTVGQTVPELLISQGGWSPSDRQRGVTHVTVAYKADAADAKNPIWTAGRPTFLWVVRGLRCYDPRHDSSVPGGAGAQRRNNPATWTWSENAEICRYNFDIGIYAEDRVDDPDMLLIGRGLSAIEAPPEMIFAAANLCDEPVALAAGGTEPRYRVGGTIYANEEFDDVEKAFAAAMGGILVQPEGTIGVEPGHAKAPVAWFTDDDLVRGTSASYSDERSDADEDWVNTVIPRYIEPTQRWSEHGAPIRRNTADVIADGGPREAPLTLRLVTSNTQAQRIGEIRRRLGRLAGTGGVTLGPRFAEIEEGDIVVWTSARRTAGVPVAFRVDSYRLDEKWQNTLALRRVASSVYSWTTADEIAPGATAEANTPPAVYGQPPAGDWSAVGGTVEGAVAAVPAITFSGGASDPHAIGILFEFRKDGDTAWTPMPVVAPGSTRQIVTAVQAGTAYQPAVTYFYDNGRGERRVLATVTTGDFTGVEGPPGASVAELTIYRASASAPATPTGGSFDVATRTLTPPSGWSLTMPTSGTRWSASGYAAWSGTSGTVTPTWFGVGGGISNGTDGDDGADGQATDVIFRRAATQPATPPDSSGVPPGWYATTGEVPASADPMWASFRTRATSASAWVHQAPRRVEGLDAINNVNRMRNTLFERGVQGWEMLTVAGVTITAPLALDIVGDARTLTFTATATASGQQAGIDTPAAYRVPVSPGERLSVQALCRSSGVVDSNLLRVQFYDAAGAQLAGTGINVQFLAGAQASFALMSGFVTVPVGASTMLVGLRTFSSGAGSFSGRLCKPMVASATAGQTTHPPFTPGHAEGADGDPGASVAELTIYRASASAPATPTGGSFDVATRVLTPPSGWSLTMPTSGTRWSASGYAAWSGTSGTVTPTWLGVGGGISNGTDGDDGADGQATDVIFRTSATQPATPPDSSGVPPGWYGTTGEVPASVDPMWASFRTRATSTSAWVHQAPRRVDGRDAINNVNRMRNTLFERGVQGWEMFAAGGVTITSPFALDIVGDARTLTFTGTASAAAEQQVAIYTPSAYHVPVTPGERLSVQALCRSTGVVGSNVLRVQFFDAAGAELAGTGTNIQSLSGAQASFALLSGFVTVPAGASTMRVVLWTIASGAGSFSGRLCKPMVASATANQTAHPPFTPGQADGADGANAKAVRLTASALGFIVASDGTNTPASITLTAEGQAVSGSPVFNVVTGAATLTGTGTSRDLTYANMSSDVVTVQVLWDGAPDTVTLYKLREGSNSLTRIVPNEAHALPADSAGNVTDYAGSGTTIQIFEGVLPLTFHTSLAPGRFTVGGPVVSPGGAITVGGRSGSGTNVCTVANHSGASAAAGAIIITYPITVQRANGAIVSLSVTQSLTKPRDGAPGAPGAPGDPGDPGISALSVSGSPSTVPVPAYFNGTPKAAPGSSQLKVFQSTIDVTAVASYGTPSSSGVTGASVSSSGLVSITGMTDATGQVTVPISYGGATATVRIEWVKVPDGNAAVSGSVAVTSLGNTSSYVTSASFNVSLAPGQVFSVNSSGSFQSSAGAYQPQLKLAFQNVTDGGAETDVPGSEVNGGTAAPAEPEVWSTSGPVENTNGVTKVFSIRLKSRRISAAGNSAAVSGTMGGSGT